MIYADLPALNSPHLEQLRFKALHNLANPSEIKPEVLQIALEESNEICKGKDVPSYARLDIAYIRLKLYCKIALDGQDELLLKNALLEVDKSPLIQESGNKSASKFYDCKQKESAYC